MRQFLRKDGTFRVLSWTPTLAKRKDMVSCSEEDKKEFDELVNKEAEARRHRFHVDGPAQAPANTSDAFSAMDEDGLKAAALEFKIKFPKNATADTKRKMLREVAAAVMAARRTGSSSVSPLKTESEQTDEKEQPKDTTNAEAGKE